MTWSWLQWSTTKLQKDLTLQLCVFSWSWRTNQIWSQISRFLSHSTTTSNLSWESPLSFTDCVCLRVRSCVLLNIFRKVFEELTKEFIRAQDERERDKRRREREGYPCCFTAFFLWRKNVNFYLQECFPVFTFKQCDSRVNSTKILLSRSYITYIIHISWAK